MKFPLALFQLFTNDPYRRFLRGPQGPVESDILKTFGHGNLSALEGNGVGARFFTKKVRSSSLFRRTRFQPLSRQPDLPSQGNHLLPLFFRKVEALFLYDGEKSLLGLRASDSRLKISIFLEFLEERFRGL